MFYLTCPFDFYVDRTRADGVSKLVTITGQATIQAQTLDAHGMVADALSFYRAVEAITKTRFHKQRLEDFFPQPTIEHLTLFIYRSVAKVLAANPTQFPGVKIESVSIDAKTYDDHANRVLLASVKLANLPSFYE